MRSITFQKLLSLEPGLKAKGQNWVQLLLEIGALYRHCEGTLKKHRNTKVNRQLEDPDNYFPVFNIDPEHHSYRN